MIKEVLISALLRTSIVHLLRRIQFLKKKMVVPPLTSRVLGPECYNYDSQLLEKLLSPKIIAFKI